MLNVMCCGCRGFLGKAGEVIRPDGFAKGERTVIFEGRVIRIPRPDRLGDFANVSAADEAAKNAGWKVSRDKTGLETNNHRCPECVRLESAERARVGHHPGREAGAWGGAVLEYIGGGIAVRRG